MSSKQTTLSIDKTTKALAIQRAEQDNIPISIVVKILLKEYGLGLIDIGIKRPERDISGFTADKIEKLEELLEEIKNKKNLSPKFSSMKSAIRWLNN
jgi:hypothetical protein